MKQKTMAEISFLFSSVVPKCLILNFFLVFLEFDIVRTFNLDVHAPVIKYGPPNSYFGFSVAEHTIWERKKHRNEPVLLVGAPKDNITADWAIEGVKRIERPGAVYRCPFSSLDNDCTQIKIDYEEPRPEYDKSDQWMGVSVSSQGTQHGGALACAHRYKSQGPGYQWGLGWCISLTNQLDEDRFWEPCAGKSNYWGHSDYGYCQAGTSATISKEGEIALGAPGPYTWRGTVFSNVLNDSSSVFQTWHQSAVEDPPSDRVPEGFEPPATSFYSYLGMSVKIGNLIGGRKTYAAGAPRSNETGQVLLFQLNGKILSVTPDHYLTGDNFCSGFGYSLAIGDFNSDGLDDLVVGAPYYHDQGTGGAIYVYMNSAQGITSRTKPLKITSRKMKEAECVDLNCHDAWFGFSVASIGDLDQDGYEDIAVGAPFEGRGAIYIFQGSSSGIIKEPSQRISAAMLPKSLHGLTSFGYSLSGGIDLDNSGYPDLLVGSYASSNVIALRSRPVADVTASISHYPASIDPKVKQCAKNGRHNNCFELRICFRYRMKPVEKFKDKLRLDFTLEAERFTGSQLVRVQFDEMSEGYQLNKSIILNEQSSKELKCVDVLAYIVNHNRDFLNPIHFLLTYSLSDKRKPFMSRGGAVPIINNYPMLNATSPQVSKGLQHSIDFIKNCGDDLKCESNLKVQGTLQLEKDESGRYIWRVGQKSELSLFVLIENHEEDAHEATLTVDLPPYIELKGIDADDETSRKKKSHSCAPFNGSLVCFIGNPLPEESSASFGIRLDMTQVNMTLPFFNISLRVNTTSTELDHEDDFDLLEISVITESDLLVRGASEPIEVIYSGKIVGESGITFLDEIGIPVLHNYEVKNVGGGGMSNVTVRVSWPYEVSSDFPQGKHLLYMTHPPKIDGSGTCYLDPLRINSRRFLERNSPKTAADQGKKELTEVPEDIQKRLKRETEVVRAESLFSEPAKKIVLLDCDLGTARCFHFYCVVNHINFGESVKISLQSRLWNTTFLEDYTHVDQVHIFSKMELDVAQSERVIQLNSENDVYKARTIARPGIDVQEPAEVPLWIIIASVCAGLVLLVLLVWLLWFIGFFRRQKHDSMMQYKAKVEKHRFDEDMEYSNLTLPRRL